MSEGSAAVGASRSSLVIGHRGMGRLRPGSTYAENSIDGFGAALALGADGIELDVHLSADGEAVVHHDAELGRTVREGDLTGKRIWDCSHEELGKAVLKGPGDQSIPTLQQVLAALKDEIGERQLWVELKRQQNRGRGRALVDKAIETLDRESLWRHAWLLSFDHEILTYARQQNSEARLAAIADLRVLRTLRSAEANRFDGVGIFHRLLFSTFIKRARGAALKVATGMPNTSREIEAVLRKSVDFICTDEVELALKTRDS